MSSIKDQNNKKLYYSIREVADMLGVETYLLRNWEKKFPMIRPKKNAKGTRLYRQEDIDTIRLVYSLVKEKGMTWDGALRKIKENPNKAVSQEAIKQRLVKVREELVAMIDELTKRG